ncbi:hypothetical protein RJ639_005452 [Escallonia herrerae]|uniref:Uncharacterized protein n=1 Tax=Escallonia herrerae TaxID=1293975 RepID=A0AA88VXF3_9ASTE|nr:hypothetical protein RJ639_005452 [Escallonia herrerae]
MHETSEKTGTLSGLGNLAILKLGNNSLSWSIPMELEDRCNLIWLDLNTNFLNGSIPPGLFKQSGNIVVALPHREDIHILNLGHSDLVVPIPQELGGVKNVAIHDLAYNKFNGSIPQSLTSLTLLGEVDLSNNNMSRMIPKSALFDTFPDYRFLNNSGLCGYPLPRCWQDPSGSLNGQHQKSYHRQESLAGSVAMGLLFSLFCVFGLIKIVIETRKGRKKKEAALEAYMDGNSYSAPANSAWKPTQCLRGIEHQPLNI